MKVEIVEFKATKLRLLVGENIVLTLGDDGDIYSSSFSHGEIERHIEFGHAKVVGTSTITITDD